MTKTQTIIYEIVQDISQRNGLSQQWNKIDNSIKEKIKEAWVEIVTKHELHHKEEAK